MTAYQIVISFQFVYIFDSMTEGLVVNYVTFMPNHAYCSLEEPAFGVVCACACACVRVRVCVLVCVGVCVCVCVC